MSRIRRVTFVATEKMGIGWKNNRVIMVVPGSQAERSGVRVGWIALMINNSQLPKKSVGDRMRSAIKRGRSFNVTFRAMQKKIQKDISICDAVDAVPARSNAVSSNEPKSSSASASTEGEDVLSLSDFSPSSSPDEIADAVVARVRRNLNCANDFAGSSSHVRYESIKKIREFCSALERRRRGDVLRIAFTKKIGSVLLASAQKESQEACREMSLQLLCDLAEGPLELDDEENASIAETLLSELVPVLEVRIGKRPFRESSEELRLLLVNVLTTLLSSSGGKRVVASSVTFETLRSVLISASRDAFPAVKSKALNALVLLSRAAPSAVHLHLKQSVEAVLSAAKHQHMRIRRTAITTLGELILCSLESDGLTAVMETLVIPAFERLPSDAAASVRSTVVDVAAQWLARTSFRYEYCSSEMRSRHFAPHLFRVVLMLVGDATPSIAIRSLQRLEWVAKYRSETMDTSAIRSSDVPMDLAVAADAASMPGSTKTTTSRCADDEDDDDDDDDVRTLKDDMYPYPFKSRPSEALRRFARRMWSTVFPLIDLSEWTARGRCSAALQLRSLLVLAESRCTASLSKLLSGLRKSMHGVVVGAVGNGGGSNGVKLSIGSHLHDCARLVGCFASSGHVLADVVPWCCGRDGLSSATQRTSSLMLLCSVLEGHHLRCRRPLSTENSGNANGDAIASDQLHAIGTKILAHTDVCGSDDARLQRQCVRLMYALADSDAPSFRKYAVAGDSKEAQLNRCVVRALLQLRAMGAHEVDAAAAAIAKRLGAPNSDSLFAFYAEDIFRTATSDEKSWTADGGVSSHGRKLFEELLRTVPTATTGFVDGVVDTFERKLLPESNDPKLRLALLACLEGYLNRNAGARSSSDDALAAALRPHVGRLMVRVLLPSIVWRVGMVEATLRKLGVATMLSLVVGVGFAQSGSRNVENYASTCFAKVQGSITSCLDDDDATTRRLALRVVNAMFESMIATTSPLDYEQVNDLYPKLLKRLDDSNDDIRASACKMLTSFWGVADPACFHRTCLTYAFDILLVHLDDPNREIQRAVFDTLLVAAHLDPSLLIEKAVSFRAKHRSPTFCDRLCDAAQKMPPRLVSKDAATGGGSAKKKEEISANDDMDVVDMGDLDEIDD